MEILVFISVIEFRAAQPHAKCTQFSLRAQRLNHIHPRRTSSRPRRSHHRRRQ
jgi:hypothetical protein